MGNVLLWIYIEARKKSSYMVRVESISDPQKHLVTSTFILLPRVYFKNVLKRKLSAGFDSAVVYMGLWR